MYKFKEFKIEELFEKIETKKINTKAKDLPEIRSDDHCLPALTAGIQNQGLARFTKRDNATVLKNVISVSANGANSGAMFYQPHEFTVLQDSYAIKWKGDNDFVEKHAYLYFVATLQKVIRGNYSWTNKAGWERIKNVHISLPVTKTGEIDFEYMVSYIRELELARIRELEAYLKVTGLTDYKLTTDEERFLEEHRTLIPLGGGKIYKNFKVRELFKLKSNPQLNKESFTFVENGKGYPYFTRTALNNGILGYVAYLNEEYKISGNSLAIGMIEMRFHYMEQDFYAGQFTKTAFPLFNQFNKRIALFFIILLGKLQKQYQSILIRDFEEAFYETELALPITKTGEINFEYMELFISVQQKRAIKNVVKWKDKELEAYQNAIAN